MQDLFSLRFAAHAREVRTRLALRAALGGLSVGLALAVPITTVAWATRHTLWIAPPLALGVLGALVALLVARLHRWTDHDVALLLDARLGTPETLSTALTLSDEAPRAARDAILAQARHALQRVGPEVLPRVLRRAHLVVPVSLAVTVTCLVASPPGTPAATPPAPRPVARVVQFESVPGLMTIERLRALDARDPAQRQRLEALAEQARRLREQLRQGMDPQAARQALSALRETIAREQRSFGNGNEQRGLEQAVRQLADNGFETASEALAQRDLETLDRALERVANAREAADRARARRALQQAAQAAEEAGAPGVAEALREEENLLHRREQRNSLLRRLAQQLGRDESVRRAAEHLDRYRSDESARDLASTLERALSQLSREERDRLTQRMREAARHAQRDSRAGNMGDERGSRRGGEREETPSADEIARMLREMANSPQGEGQEGDSDGGQQSQGGASGAGIPLPVMTPGGGAGARQTQRALDRAMDGARQAGQQTGLGGNSQGRGQNGQSGNGSGANGQGGEGPSRGGGPGSHHGQTGAVQGDDAMRARAHARMNPGAPLPGNVTTLTPGHSGGVARVLRTGDLRSVGPSEVQGVDRSDIPAEYRDQVRVYFQP